MGLLGVFWRFFLLYLLLIISIGFVLDYFGATGGAGANAAVLVASVFWVCSVFVKKNGRYFNPREKVWVVGGLVAIDSLLQVLLGIATFALLETEIPFRTLFIATGVVALLHALAIYLVVSVAKRPFLKQGLIRE